MKRLPSLLFCCFVSLGFSIQLLQSHAQDKGTSDWLEVLKGDARLKKPTTLNAKGKPGMDEWLELMEKATGVPLSLAEPPENGKVVFGGMNSMGVPGWVLMKQIAKANFTDGRWEKKGDGYALFGKPNVVITPEQEKEQAAKKAAFDEALAKAPKPKPATVLFDLPKGHPLRVDPEIKHKYAPKMTIKPPPDPPGTGPHHADLRLRQRISITLAKPKVDAALAMLAEKTKVQFTFAQDIQNVRPATNGIFVNEVPAWEVMDYLARAEQVDGHWVKDGDGYRLVPNGGEVPLPPEVVAAEAHRFQMEILVAIGVLFTFAIAGFLLFQWRRRV